jgi:DNA modification methylase
VQIETRTIASLRLYPGNARTHSEEQVAQIAASITEFGFTNPVLIAEDGEIIAGHGRVMAAQSLGLTEVPTIALGHLTADQRRAYMIADNKLALNAGWDEELLRAELEALEAANFDLGVTGFSDEELRVLMAVPNERDPDETPPVEAEAVSRIGDVWLLGEHRLMCGDSTGADDVARLLDGKRADCVFTSPPYGVGVDYGATYSDTLDNLRGMLPKMAALWIDAVQPGGFAVVNFGDIVAGAVAGAEPCEYPMALEYWGPFRDAGWRLWSRRVWCKPNARTHSPWAIQSNRAASDWEHVWTWKAPGRAVLGRVNGEHQSANGWFDTTSEHGVDLGKDTHGAGMAVALPVRMLAIHVRAGHGVLEPFSGTGTTITAAEMTGRRCYAMEISPQYVDVSVRRWEQFTGREATLEADGRTFADVADARIAEKRLAEIAADPMTLVSGAELEQRLAAL